MSQEFVGPDQVQMYRAIVIRSALQLYERTGMQANRAYTPTAMIQAAREITGKGVGDIPARGYRKAIEALSDWIAKYAEPMTEEEATESADRLRAKRLEREKEEANEIN